MKYFTYKLNFTYKLDKKKKNLCICGVISCLDHESSNSLLEQQNVQGDIRDVIKKEQYCAKRIEKTSTNFNYAAPNICNFQNATLKVN